MVLCVEHRKRNPVVSGETCVYNGALLDKSMVGVEWNHLHSPVIFKNLEFTWVFC